jgi:hypothetical protein
LAEKQKRLNMRLVKSIKETVKNDKLFLLYLLIFAMIMIFLLNADFFQPDEGTHALLALFYRDMLTTALKNLNFSFDSLYNFGISYLVHYPKLQVFYSPLYHLITGLVFYSILGITQFAARFSNLFFGLLTIIAFYYIAKKIFDKKTALISAVLFSLLPMTLVYIKQAMMEFTTFFFLLCSLYFYLKATESKKMTYYVITAFFSFLAVMSKNVAVLSMIVYGIPMLLYKKWKNLFVMVAVFGLLSLPYILLISSLNGFEINRIIYTAYAFESMVFELFALFPFITLFCAITAYEIVKFFLKKKPNPFRNKMLAILLLWFVIFFFGTMVISFKDRYFIYFLIPAIMVSSRYISKLEKAAVIIFILLYAGVSLMLPLQSPCYVQVEPAAREIFDGLQNGGNVAMLSEGDCFYSSAFMFYMSKLDKDKNVFVFRPCLFFEKNKTEIINFFKSNNVRFVIAVPNEMGYEKVGEIKDSLNSIKTGYAELYSFKEYDYREMDEYCNYICLTEGEVCTKYKNPFDVFKTQN